MIKNSTVCRLAWTGFTVNTDGKTQPCCIFKGVNKNENGEPLYVQRIAVTDILLSKTMVDLRKAMRNGDQPAGCAECWKDEAIGNTSKREFYTTSNHFDENIDWDSEPTSVTEMQVILDNNCNLKCRTCGPFCSTKWAAEATKVNATLSKIGVAQLANLKLSQFVLGNAGDKSGNFWVNRNDWIGSIKRLEIVGGEPFYSKQWHQIFRDIVNSGRANEISVSVSTNGFIYYRDIVEEIGPRLKNLNLPMSIDGVGSVFEYLRFPADWPTVRSNIKKYNAMHDTHPSITSPIIATISWMNGLNLLSLYKMCREEIPTQNLWFNLVRGPEHCALWAIPQKLKLEISKVLSLIDHPDIPGILKFMHSKSITDEQFIENLKIFRISDLIRGEDLLEKIPELTPFINTYWDTVKEQIREL